MSAAKSQGATLYRSEPITRATGGGNPAGSMQIPANSLVRAAFVIVHEPLPGSVVPSVSLGDGDDPEAWVMLKDCKNARGDVIAGGRLAYRGKAYHQQTHLTLRAHEPFSGGALFICAEVVDISNWPVTG